MNFGEALELLKNGYSMCRSGWNGSNIFIKLQRPDEHSKMSSPYIYIDTRYVVSNSPTAIRSCVPWVASQTDLLAEDWRVL